MEMGRKLYKCDTAIRIKFKEILFILLILYVHSK